MNIGEQIRSKGGADARFPQRDHGVISATVFDGDGIACGSITLTRKELSRDEAAGLLHSHVMHDNARDPRYQWRVVVITPVGGKPPRRYHYLGEFDPTATACSTREKAGLRLARELGLRLTWGVGGGRNRLHEDDWPTLAARLASNT